MAIALQSSQLVWQKVATALAGASPAAQLQFKQLKMWLATQKKNPQLQFIPFSAADIIVNLGSTAAPGACTLYGFYALGARVSGTTSAFIAVHDGADNTTGTVLTGKMNVLGNEFVALYPQGFIITTDVTVSSATTVGGTTESAVGDAANGFVLIGA